MRRLLSEIIMPPSTLVVTLVLLGSVGIVSVTSASVRAADMQNDEMTAASETGASATSDTDDEPTAAVSPTTARNAQGVKASKVPRATKDTNAQDDKAPKQITVTADQSLEWYQDKHIYVARGNAKAVRGEMVVEGDILTAHEREKPEDAVGLTPEQKAAIKKKELEDKAAQRQAQLQAVATAKANGTPPPPANDTGDIDKMTADGNVRITDPKQRVTGDHGTYDLDTHVMVMTGNNLKYETEKETVTARDTLEYYEDKKIAVARGHAIGIRMDRHIEGDVLTAEFRDTAQGANELWKMTGDGHVIVITKSDVSRGDHMVYDAARNIAVLRDHVRITRADGTELSGDVGEVDFANNQSRLLNKGHGRVSALLGTHSGPKKDKATGTDGSDGPTTGQKPPKVNAAKNGNTSWSSTSSPVPSAVSSGQPSAPPALASPAASLGIISPKPIATSAPELVAPHLISSGNSP